jgi:hypothetical protein
MERGQNSRGVGKRVAGASNRRRIGVKKDLIAKKVRFEVPKKEKSLRYQGIRVFQPKEISQGDEILTGEYRLSRISLILS